MTEYTYNPNMVTDASTLTDADFTDGMRAIRNYLLESCDWTQTVDAPLSDAKKAEWKSYRATLRDFPSTWTPAPTVTFPDPPSN